MRPIEQPPLTPDLDEAQSWLSEELSRGEYHRDLDPVSKFFARIYRSLAESFNWDGHGVPPVQLIVLVMVIVLVAVALIALILNPVRARRRVSASVFDEDGQSAQEVRAALKRALAEGDWDQAFVWRYRILVLEAGALGVLADTPGLTAHEAASQAARSAPALALELMAEADLFDTVRYGEGHAGSADVERLGALTERALDALRRTATAGAGAR